MTNEQIKNAESVIQYLGRYTLRVAISNEIIIKIGDNKVTFKWRDYKDNNKKKKLLKCKILTKMGKLLHLRLVFFLKKVYNRKQIVIKKLIKG